MRKGLYDTSDSLYQEALNLDLRKAFPDSIEYDARVADIQYEIGKLKLAQNLEHIEEQIEEAFPFFCNASEKFKRLAANDLNKYASKLVEMLYYLGLSYTYFEQYEESEMAYNEAIEICHRMSEEESSECDMFLAWTQSELGDLYSHLDSLEKSMIAYDEAVEVYEQLYQNKPELKEGYVGALGKQSFLAIYLKRFAKAEQQAEIALNIDPGQQWIFSSLAASKLFQGKYDEAEEIYRNMISGQNEEMKNRFIEDLDDFEAAGIVPEERKSDVERIRKILSK
jgi:tetratricopeptide (TPR) repeat protein